MKNKRWKREAKRIIGECMHNKFCLIDGMKICGCYDRCHELFPIGWPDKSKIRKIEKLCKGVK